MTTPSLNETATVRDLLFADTPVAPTDQLAESLREHGTVRSLVTRFPGLTTAAEREVATQTDGLLSLNLFDLAAEGWKRYAALKDAARRTRDAPITEEIVALVTHRIASRHHPSVEVFVDGKSVGTVEIELTVTFEMAGVLAVVREGRLTAIKSGRCTVTGTLAIQRIEAAKRQHRFDLPGAVHLQHGVPLLDPAPATTPAE
jgi:hypothetical protein